MAEPGKLPAGRGGRGVALARALALQREADAAGRRPGEDRTAAVLAAGVAAAAVGRQIPSTASPQPSLASDTGLSPGATLAPMGRAARLQQLHAHAQAHFQPTSHGLHSYSSPAVASPSVAAPQVAPAQLPARLPPISGGRGAALARFAASSSTSTRISSPTPSVTSGVGVAAKQLEQLQLRSGDAGHSLSAGHSSVAAPEMTRPFDRSRESASDPVYYRGSEGRSIPCSINHIPIRLREGINVNEYAVMYSPNVDSVQIRYKLFNQHRELIGPAKSFDGSKLFLPKRFPDKETVLMSQHPVDGSSVTITLRFITVRSISECPQLFDLLFRRVLTDLNLVPIGRQSFDPCGSVQIPQHDLEMWPGYITAIQNFEGGLMLLAETSHRVLRTTTVLEQLYHICESNSTNYKDVATKAIIGCVVLTRYNRKTYRIDDIVWDQNPLSTFDCRGEPITYAEYYRKHYDITITDMKQPLLLHLDKKKARGMEEKTSMLCMVPELSFQTGLTDDMRSNFHLMKEIGSHTRLAPNKRQFQLMKLVNSINNNPKAKAHLDAWGIYIKPETLQLEARILREEKITFQNSSVYAGADASWQREWGKHQVLSAVNFVRWIVIYTQRDQVRGQNFIEMAKRVGPQLGIEVAHPKIIKLPDDRNNSLMQCLREVISNDLQIVVVINPTSRDDRYSLIKKICCCDNPIPSQVINGRTIDNQMKLRSVCQNIVLQMNCKLGGELWAVEIPIKKLMVCGIDVYHDSTNRSKSVLSLVSSLNDTLTRWFCRSTIQMSGQEIGTGLEMCLVQCLKKYHDVNHNLPEKVIIFRDGVGDGQLEYVEKTEIPQLYAAFKSFGADYVPMLTFVVVQKRINTRIFAHARQGLDNPAPGTVLDHTVTKRHWEDFFLVSQHVRQGTVTPTHYVVVHNKSPLTPDRIQRLTYKMTHLYYNWPGTVRVPAPCQYAHKLAALIGQNIHNVPSDELADRLFFL